MKKHLIALLVIIIIVMIPITTVVASEMVTNETPLITSDREKDSAKKIKLDLDLAYKQVEKREEEEKARIKAIEEDKKKEADEKEEAEKEEAEKEKKMQSTLGGNNLLCSTGTGISYGYLKTNSTRYVDGNGFLRDKETDAYLVAMGTRYKRNNLYSINLSNGQKVTVKVIDNKANGHTVDRCYSSTDKSSLEFWMDKGSNHEIISTGNSLSKGVTLTDIYLIK